MGFLSSLMGLRHRAVVTIAFYDQNSSSSVRVVEYQNPQGPLTDSDWGWLLPLYFAKTLYTLGDSEAPILVAGLSTYTAEVLEKPIGLYLAGRQFPSSLQGQVEAIPPRPSAGGITIDVYQKDSQPVTISTHIPTGLTTGQLALSTWVFFDWVLRRITERSHRYLSVVLMAFLAKYYREIGSYSDPSSVIAGPTFAVDQLAAMQSRIENPI